MADVAVPKKRIPHVANVSLNGSACCCEHFGGEAKTFCVKNLIPHGKVFLQYIPRAAAVVGEEYRDDQFRKGFVETPEACSSSRENWTARRWEM